MNKGIKINSIIIENFQSHKYTKINFNDFVTVIIGPSDSGKTAVIRAMKWVFFNEPSGVEIIKKGANEAKVTIELNSGFKIIRGRSKSKNYYEILSPDGELDRFEGFGVNVPKEIADLSGIVKINLGNNYKLSLNISEQLDSPFLITESPSIKANALGKLAGVDIIDQALTKISKELFEINGNKKTLEKEINLQQEKLTKFKYLDSEKIKLNRLESIFFDVDNINLRLNKLIDLKEKLEKNKKQTIETNKSLDKFKNLDTIFSIFYSLNSDVNNLTYYKKLHYNLSITIKNIEGINHILNKVDVDTIDHLYEDITKNYLILEKYKYYQNSMFKTNKQIENLKFIFQKYSKLTSIDSNLLELKSLIPLMERLQNLKFKYDDINSDLFTLDKYLNSLNINYKKAVNRYIELLKKSEICPICYNKIDDKHLKNIIKELEV